MRLSNRRSYASGQRPGFVGSPPIGSAMSRVCPVCEAGVGERCWSTVSIYPRRIQNVHRPRRAHRTPPFEGPAA